MSDLFALAFYVGLLGMFIFTVLMVLTKVLKRGNKVKLYKKMLLGSIVVSVISFVGFGVTNVVSTVEQEVSEESKKEEVQAVASASEEKEDEVTEESNEVAPTVYKVNEAATLNDVSYTVTSAVSKDTVAGYTSESGTFLVVDVTVQNDSNKAVTINNGDFTLLLGAAEYKTHDNTTAYHEGGFFLEEVNPGLNNSNSIVFEVPKDYKDATLRIVPNVFKDGDILIEL